MPNAFASWKPGEWRPTAIELEGLLTDKEHEAAMASTPNAHFTSPMVIAGVWNGLRHMGVTDGAHILEPAMGVGHFLGLAMPESMNGGHRTAGVLSLIPSRRA